MPPIEPDDENDSVYREYSADDREKTFSYLSHAYETGLQQARVSRRIGNAAIIGMPLIGAANYLIAHETLQSPYVWGAAVGGVAIKAACEVFGRVIDKELLRPILSLNQERFAEDFDQE